MSLWRRITRGKRPRRELTEHERIARFRAALELPARMAAQAAVYGELLVWLSTGFGAVVALLATNRAEAAVFLGHAGIAQLFWLAVDGLVLGVLGKYSTAQAAVAAEVLDPNRPAVGQNLLDGLTLIFEQRLEAIRGAIDDVVPWYFRWNARRGVKSGLSDPLALQKHAAKSVSQGVVCCWTQMLIAAVGLGLVLWRAVMG